MVCAIESGMVYNSILVNAAGVGALKYNISEASSKDKNLSIDGDDNPNNWERNTTVPVLTIDNE